MVEKMKKENLKHEKTITEMELQAKNCKEELLITLETQAKNLTSLTEVVHDIEVATKKEETSIKIYFCGYQESVSPFPPGTITYSSMFYSRNTEPTGGLSLSTGVFTAPYSGVYTINWSLYAENDASE